MTDAEALALFDETTSETEEVIAAAQGWPAVVSLASVSGASPSDLMAAPNLVSFLADEIFRKLDRRTRRSLCELAIYDIQGRRAALQRLRTQEAERLVATAVHHGFLDEPSPGQFEMHPLLRSFLELKLREEGQPELRKTVTRVVKTLFDLGLWDESYDVIHKFGEHRLLVDLIRLSSAQLLAQGRTSTLRTWIVDADPSAPTVQHATSELALREGKYHQSETLAPSWPPEERAIRTRKLAHSSSREEPLTLLQDKRGPLSTTAEPRRLRRTQRSLGRPSSESCRLRPSWKRQTRAIV